MMFTKEQNLSSIHKHVTVGIRILAAGPPTTGRAQGWAPPPIGKAETKNYS